MLAGLMRTVRNRGILGTAKFAANLMTWHLLRFCRRRFVTASIHDYRMVLDLRDPGLSRQLFVVRDRERVLGQILTGLLRKGMSVIDVGGNLGYYPLMESSLVGEEGKVYVLEPFPPNFELLNRNVRLNARENTIKTYMLAALDAVGQKPFHVAVASNLGTMFPRTSDTGIALGLTGRCIEVETVDLSTFLQHLGKIDLIRMDTEGAEVGILRGLIPAVASGLFDGCIAVETHASRYDDGDNDIRPVLEELFALGYRPGVVTSEDEAVSCLRDRGYEPRSVVRESNTMFRGIYPAVGNEDVLTLVKQIGAIRDLVLVRCEQKDEAPFPGKGHTGESPPLRGMGET